MNNDVRGGDGSGCVRVFMGVVIVALVFYLFSATINDTRNLQRRVGQLEQQVQRLERQY